MDKVKKTEPKKEERKDLQSFYIPFDLAASINERNDGIQGGESCRIDGLKDVFAWMRGFVNGWYGWSSDGKGSLLDYLFVMAAKYDKRKICMFKPEDMDTVINRGKPEIKANRIYKNLAWSLTGKTWNPQFAAKHKSPLMTEDEEMEATKFIKQHFFVIYPEDRLYTSMIDNYRFMYEHYGIDYFLLDPFGEVELPSADRGDERLIKAFMAIKKFAMETNSCFNIINHPRSMHDVKEKDGSFKVVNQFMQLGGAAWDIKMDGQFSIHRPFRHKNPNDPRVHLYNLKQRQAEVVGVNKGVSEDIVFDFLKKQYYFNGMNPMDGTLAPEAIRYVRQPPETKKTKDKKQDKPPLNFTDPKNPGDCPF